jgi:hypothetical protein
MSLAGRVIWCKNDGGDRANPVRVAEFKAFPRFLGRSYGNDSSGGSI